MSILDCNYQVFNHNIVSSENCRLIDERGKEYIDFEAGVWCTSLGHNNKQVNEAIIKQLNLISHIGYRCTTKEVNEAAEKVLSLLNFTEGKCVFLNSGSEAVEFAVQLSRNITDKPYFLCLSNYFLSSYGSSANREKDQWISLDLSKYDGNNDNFLTNIPF